MEQEKKVLYTEENVHEALRLVAMGVAGILCKDDAEKTLAKLPTSLQNQVMVMTIAAVKTKEAASKLSILDALLGGMSDIKN